MPVSLIPSGKKVKRPGSKFDLAGLLGSTGNLVPSIVVFLIVGALYGGAVFWAGQLEGRIENIEAQKSDILSRSREQDVTELKTFARQARALDSIVRDHNLPSQLFDPFEDSIHENVVILSFALSVDSANLELSGLTQNFEMLGEQFVIWRSESDYVENVVLAGFNKTSEGQVEFSATIEVNNAFLGD